LIAPEIAAKIARTGPLRYSLFRKSVSHPPASHGTGMWVCETLIMSDSKALILI